MRVVAGIIARGGSRRLPRKNVRPFCGIPLVAWSIIQAKCSRLVDEVWLSTDDDEIQAVGEQYGANVIRRPDWPDADTASGQRPTLHMLNRIMEATGDFDVWVSMLPTVPLKKPDDIDRMIAKFIGLGLPDGGVLQAIPQRETVLYEEVGNELQCTLFDKSYQYYRAVGGTGVVRPDWYQVSCAADDSDAAIDVDTKAKAAARVLPLSPAVMLDGWQDADVDTLEEFELGEVLMEHFILKGRGPAVYYDYAREGNNE